MKKMMKLSLIILMALFTASVTSCSDDSDYYYGDPYGNSQDVLYEITQTLRGYWMGKTAVRFKSPDELLRERMYDTDIESDMYDSNSRNGRGRQVDHFNGEAAYDRTFSRAIDSRSGDVVVTYDGGNEKEFQMTIDSDDMKLDDYTFSGMTVGTGESNEFSYTCYACAKKVTMDFKE